MASITVKVRCEAGVLRRFQVQESAHTRAPPQPGSPWLTKISRSWPNSAAGIIGRHFRSCPCKYFCWLAVTSTL
jgi:hypothetical protein